MIADASRMASVKLSMWSMTQRAGSAKMRRPTTTWRLAKTRAQRSLMVCRNAFIHVVISASKAN